MRVILLKVLPQSEKGLAQYKKCLRWIMLNISNIINVHNIPVK